MSIFSEFANNAKVVLTTVGLAIAMIGCNSSGDDIKADNNGTKGSRTDYTLTSLLMDGTTGYPATATLPATPPTLRKIVANSGEKSFNATISAQGNDKIVFGSTSGKVGSLKAQSNILTTGGFDFEGIDFLYIIKDAQGKKDTLAFKINATSVGRGFTTMDENNLVLKDVLNGTGLKASVAPN